MGSLFDPGGITEAEEWGRIVAAAKTKHLSNLVYIVII